MATLPLEPSTRLSISSRSTRYTLQVVPRCKWFHAASGATLLPTGPLVFNAYHSPSGSTLNPWDVPDTGEAIISMLDASGAPDRYMFMLPLTNNNYSWVNSLGTPNAASATYRAGWGGSRAATFLEPNGNSLSFQRFPAVSNGSASVNFDSVVISVSAVPEPSSLMLVGLALYSLCFYRHRRP